MKKQMIVLAAAALLFGQATQAAGSGKETKPAGAREANTRDAKGSATRTALGGASSAKGSFAALESAKLLPRLSPDKLSAFEAALGKNPTLEAAAKDILAQSKTSTLFELAQARAEALVNIQKLDTGKTADAVAALVESARHEQAYVALTLRAGKSAEGWDPATRENLTFILKEANTALASGTKTISEAMIEANTALASVKKVRLNLDDVFKLCK